jgi:uncharacterized protein YndB with AHSA1/START domain
MTMTTDRIEKRIDLDAPVSRVWRALTDHREFGQWFGVDLTSPFVAGETTRGQVTYPGYEHLAFEVEVQELREDHLFTFRWHPAAVDPAVDYSAEPQTLVEFRLEEIDGGTRLYVTESGFDALPPERRDEALRMNASGWAEQMANIAKHVGAR